jgi:hypothetical protein
MALGLALLAKGAARTGLVLVIALSAGMCGCSFVFMRAAPSTPPPRPAQSTVPSTEVECTSSRLAPVVDTLGAVVTGGLTLLLAVCPGDPDYEGEESPPTCDWQLAAAAVGTVAYVVSAAYGFSTAANCDRATSRAVNERGPVQLTRPAIDERTGGVRVQSTL